MDDLIYTQPLHRPMCAADGCEHEAAHRIRLGTRCGPNNGPCGEHDITIGFACTYHLEQVKRAKIEQYARDYA